MARMEYYILNDPDLSFKDILKRHLTGEPLSDKKPEKEKKETKKVVVEEEKETRSKKRGSPAKRTRKSEKEKTEDEKEETEEMDTDEKTEKKGGREPRKSSSEEKDEKSMPAPTMTPERRKVSISIQPPQISLQQMEQMMAKGSKYDVELMNDLVTTTFFIIHKMLTYPPTKIHTHSLPQKSHTCKGNTYSTNSLLTLLYYIQ